jgi:ABC-type multidrug transport system fused ATPase/permease subunit
VNDNRRPWWQLSPRAAQRLPKALIAGGILSVVVAVLVVFVAIPSGRISVPQVRTYLQASGAIFGLILAIIAIAVSRSIARKARQSLEVEKSSTLSDRIAQLTRNLTSSSGLIDEIQAELQLQVTALERIHEEAEQNRQLAALHADEAEAVRKLVAATIEGAQAKVEKPSKRQQWLFFLAGLFFSIPLGVGVNFLYDIIAH